MRHNFILAPDVIESVLLKGASNPPSLSPVSVSTTDIAVSCAAIGIEKGMPFPLPLLKERVNGAGIKILAFNSEEMHQLVLFCRVEINLQGLTLAQCSVLWAAKCFGAVVVSNSLVVCNGARTIGMVAVCVQDYVASSSTVQMAV